jgi:hypothetical protein
MLASRIDTARNSDAGSAGARFDGYFFTYFAWRFS